MTRYLPGILEDAHIRGSNDETEHLFAYHHATKHTYQSVRANAHFLDWKNQPDPFRAYEGTSQVVLLPEPSFPDAGTFAAMGALAEITNIPGGPHSKNAEQIQLDANWLSRLLFHSMAVSAWKKV